MVPSSIHDLREPDTDVPATRTPRARASREALSDAQEGADSLPASIRDQLDIVSDIQVPVHGGRIAFAGLACNDKGVASSSRWAFAVHGKPLAADWPGHGPGRGAPAGRQMAASDGVQALPAGDVDVIRIEDLPHQEGHPAVSGCQPLSAPTSKCNRDLARQLCGFARGYSRRRSNSGSTHATIADVGFAVRHFVGAAAGRLRGLRGHQLPATLPATCDLVRRIRMFSRSQGNPAPRPMGHRPWCQASGRRLRTAAGAACRLKSFFVLRGWRVDRGMMKPWLAWDQKPGAGCSGDLALRSEIFAARFHAADWRRCRN